MNGDDDDVRLVRPSLAVAASVDIRFALLLTFLLRVKIICSILLVILRQCIIYAIVFAFHVNVTRSFTHASLEKAPCMFAFETLTKEGHSKPLAIQFNVKFIPPPSPSQKQDRPYPRITNSPLLRAEVEGIAPCFGPWCRVKGVRDSRKSTDHGKGHDWQVFPDGSIRWLRSALC